MLHYYGITLKNGTESTIICDKELDYLLNSITTSKYINVYTDSTWRKPFSDNESVEFDQITILTEQIAMISHAETVINNLPLITYQQ